MNTYEALRMKILSVLVTLSPAIAAIFARFTPRKRVGALGVVFGVVTVVILGIVLILGALVFFAFSNSLPTGLVTGAQQSTLNSIVATGASAISLLEVVLIVAAAGLIIAAVFAYMAISRRKLRAVSQIPR
jgi:drug/metabolite transporter (DMT)-like permease